MAKTIGIIKQVNYGFTQCVIDGCTFRKEWHAVNARTSKPIDMDIGTLRRWALEAGWTQNARQQLICPNCSQGKPPITAESSPKTVADVVTILDDLAKKMQSSNASTAALTERMRGQLAFPDDDTAERLALNIGAGPSQADIDTALVQFQRELNNIPPNIFADGWQEDPADPSSIDGVTQADIDDLTDDGDDRYNMDDELEAAVSAVMPRMTEAQAMVYVYRMMAGAQKARSIFIENNGDPDTSPATKHLAESLSPWLFGPKCILIGLQRVIENHERGVPLDPTTFYNFVDIATQREIGISIAAQLPFLRPELSWLQGWLPDDDTTKEE